MHITSMWEDNQKQGFRSNVYPATREFLGAVLHMSSSSIPHWPTGLHYRRLPIVVADSPVLSK